MKRSVFRSLTLLSRRGLATETSAEADVALTSEAPKHVLNRKAIIYSPARTAAQQGLRGTVYSDEPAWKIDFDTTEKWENPLMGWTSTADPLENTFRADAFGFYTKEQAISFAIRQGWSYEVIDYNERKIDRSKRFATYGDNFSTKRGGTPDLSTFRSNTDAPPKPAAKSAKTPPKK